MKHIYRLAPLFLFLLASQFALAESLETARPEEVGLSAERLARIDAVMQQHVEDGSIPGALALIARNGKIAYQRSFGMADMDNEKPIGPDTLFRIYSMSKPITSVGVMMLFEEGHFLLSDPVSDYLPELGGLDVAVKNWTDAEANVPVASEGGMQITMQTVPAEHDMTVRDLLRHTSGFTYGFFGETPVDKTYLRAGVLITDKTIEETVEKLGEIPLMYESGTQWHYGVSTDVLGRLIEVLSGQPLDEYFRDRIFEPLGMEDTGFNTGVEKSERLSVLYEPDGNGGFRTMSNPWVRNYEQPTTHYSGGGGLVSTAGDYLKFCQMMLNGGELDGTRLLSRKTVELMTTDHLGDVEVGMTRDGVGFGLGFAVNLDQGQIGALGSAGEYSWGGAAGTRFWIDPVEKLIGVYMVQILPHTGLKYGHQFKSLAYQAIAD